jgi:hypothetical protein
MKKVFTTLAIISVIAYACTKGGGTTAENPNPDPPGGGGSCDTANMQYLADVVPILQNNCYRCHGTNTNSGSSGRVLEGYENLKPYAESGTLIGVITHAQGFIPMPQDASKLSDCNINKIKSWINNGMKNN